MKDRCFRCSKYIHSKDLLVANDKGKYMLFHYWCGHKYWKEVVRKDPVNQYNPNPQYPD